MREMELGPQSPPSIPGAAGAEAPVSGSHLWDRQPLVAGGRVEPKRRLRLTASCPSAHFVSWPDRKSVV